jgi:Tetratricopeptide repeat
MTDSPRIEELKRRVQLDPASIAFAALAEEYRRSGRYEEAITVCRTGLERHPSYISAHVTLGRALLEVGRYEEAQQELEHVLKVAPENLAAIRGLADIHSRQGQKSEGSDLSASAMAEMAAALAPLQHSQKPATPAAIPIAPHNTAKPAAAVPRVSRLQQIIGPPDASLPQPPAAAEAAGEPKHAAPPAVAGTVQRAQPLRVAAAPEPVAVAGVKVAPAPQAPPVAKPAVSTAADLVPPVDIAVAPEAPDIILPSPQGTWWPEDVGPGSFGASAASASPAAPPSTPATESAVAPPVVPSVEPGAPPPADDIAFLDGNWDAAAALPWEAVPALPAEPAPLIHAVPVPAAPAANPVLERLEAFLLAIEKARAGAGDLHIL